jgi:NhaP-type Na+/H+ or K+/H+ antiporter
VDPPSLGVGLFGIVDFAVAVILFEGGLNLEASRLRRQEFPIRRLITWGAMITLCGTAVLARIFLGWSWSMAFLFGSLVVVTGPTVVGPLLRDMRLRPHLKTVLEAEGVLIDPIGAILAILVLNITLASEVQMYATETIDVVFRFGFGLFAGLLGGFLLGWTLRSRKLVPHGFENIFTLATVVLLFHGADHVISQSGVLAVTIAGVVVGNMKTPVDRDLREFKDQLTILLVGMLFILLAADVRLEQIQALGSGGWMLLAGLILVIRPLNVWVSTLGSKLSWQERVFIGWVAPRGIVAAAIASITATILENHEVSGGPELRALVFLTIAGTVGLVGVTAKPLASLLQLRLPNRDRVAILGAEGLGLVLGKEFLAKGKTVVFLDSDPKQCHQAEQAGFPVVFGDVLQERTLIRAQMELVGTTIGLTPNEHLNSLFVEQTRTMFGVPQALVALNSFAGEDIPEHIQRQEADVLFEEPHDIERWSVRLRHKDVDVGHFEFHQPMGTNTDESDINEEPLEGLPEGESKKLPARQERFVILTLEREGAVSPMTRSLHLKSGDVASVALYLPEREQAISELRALGWVQQKKDMKNQEKK